MAFLFERFVGRLINDWAVSHGLRSQLQGPDRGALLDASGAVYRQVRPDIVVYRANVPLAVLDAKYKPYWQARGPGSPPVRKISNADLYQLFFYAQRLQQRHRLATPPSAIIVAPLPELDEQSDGVPVETRYRRVRWRTVHEELYDVHLLLVPMARILRELASGRLDGTESDLTKLLLAGDRP